MKRKLQVFISSTFTDLQVERQAAVQSILNAGHIPAGMELFTAGDESQKQIIKRWIDESDAYVLILGGRYGSIDNETGKSYTHWEYDYAEVAVKPRFAIVLSDKAIQEKIVALGYKDATEQNNPQLHKDFRDRLLKSTLVRLVDDLKDIENGILKSLREIELREDLTGWVSGKLVAELEKELVELKRNLRSNSNEVKLENKWFNDIAKVLEESFVPEESRIGINDDFNLLRQFVLYGERLKKGINAVEMINNRSSRYIIGTLLPHFIQYGLVTNGERNSFVLTERGIDFLEYIGATR